MAKRLFKRRSRLLDASAYSRVFKEAKRSRDRMFTVLYKENGEQEARLGMAISKKHCRLAVRRNRLKRVVRESFRHHCADLKGLDVVVLNQLGAMRAGNQALFDSLHQHWQRCRSTQAGEVG
ncbi:MAG: ribonuclease P protein component [Proteobacteria bacterium]|nr:ribonuclease P protein component [Pseudomonadota bacterium]